MSDARKLRSLIRALVRRFSVSERADVQCCGMTVAQAATIEALDRGGALRLGKLSELLGISPSTLTRNLARLEESGYAVREADPEDGRASRVRLTPAGRGAARRLETIEDGFASAVLARLEPETRRRAVEALGALLDAVRQETESCCPGAFDHLVEVETEETHV